MSLLFRKPAPEDVYQDIASKIVISSLSFRAVIKEDNNKLSADAGAEVVYFLLYHLLIALCNLFDEAKSIKIYKQIRMIVISDYCGAVLTKDVPDEVLYDLVDQMCKDIENRHTLYGNCKTVVDKSNSKNTMMFALAVLINNALKRTNRSDILEIVSGQKTLTESDLIDLPRLGERTTVAVHVLTAIKDLNLEKALKALR